MLLKKDSHNGFSVLEILSAALIIAVLAVVGIKSYQTQTNKAEQAEAQQSLSYLYSSQKIFYNNWNSYHENLVLVGVVLQGVYNYDVGFTLQGHSLTNYPKKFAGKGIENFIEAVECASFKEICDGNCYNKIDSAIQSYFSESNCEVLGRQEVKGCNSDTKCGKSGEATASGFTAIATEKLRDVDIWSINQSQQLVHEKDGG